MGQPASDPLAAFLATAGVAVLDGGLATELEKAGFDLDHPLWSARLLMTAPEAIARVHRSYLAAGADCITTASYQGTFAGFAREGRSRSEAEWLLRQSVALAREERDRFWADERNRAGRLRPLVAASVGPYGAFLANGAEYTGDYDLDEAGLREFHRERLELLAASQADLLACETIPSAAEARALAALLAASPGLPAWVSFSCRDGARLRDGTPLADIVRLLDPLPRVLAIGVNCTAPEHVESLLRSAAAATAKPLVAYPNSGEAYDAARKAWSGTAATERWGELGRVWRAAGARLVGGCCRTGPAEIRRLRESLPETRSSV
jgi:homocysteine S-methyltransferase